ncbi:hypothetical protein P3L10_018910 [Capsicum annuum]
MFWRQLTNDHIIKKSETSRHTPTKGGCLWLFHLVFIMGFELASMGVNGQSISQQCSFFANRCLIVSSRD